MAETKGAPEGGGKGLFLEALASPSPAAAGAAVLDATRALDPARLQRLVAAGAPTNERGAGGVTPLILATDLGATLLARTLIEGGAEPDTRDDRGMSALMYAAKLRHTDIARMLLEAGADADLQEPWGRTALHIAAAEVNGDRAAKQPRARPSLCALVTEQRSPAANCIEICDLGLAPTSLPPAPCG